MGFSRGSPCCEWRRTIPRCGTTIAEPDARQLFQLAHFRALSGFIEWWQSYGTFVVPAAARFRKASSHLSLLASVPNCSIAIAAGTNNIAIAAAGLRKVQTGERDTHTSPLLFCLGLPRL